ncbi:MAG: general secretion pathway protein GspK [Alphaproteobacteria bacterium]|nr:general secretion pathway protein GspK [Alphaproteobacteria bacterium]
MLWALTAIALLAAAAQSLTATSYDAERRALDAAQAQSVLDAAVTRAVLGISDRRPRARWRVDGTARMFVFRDAAVRILVQDELGRVDLNAASAATIRQVFLGQGLELDAATRLSDRIADWREAPGPGRLNGGSDADYKAAGLAYVPRHGAFQTVEELRLVLGMTASLFAKVRGALTVYSHRPTFDPAVATPQALAVLYPDDPEKIAQILRARAEAGANDLAGPILPAPGHAFTIEAEIARRGRTYRRCAVIELTGDAQRPFFALAWQ